MTADEVIKIVVTRERFVEFVSTDHAMYFQLTDKECYDYMCNFVMNGTGVYLSVEEARKKFKKIPFKEFNGYATQFMKAVENAFVPPPNGEESDAPSSPE